MFINSVILLLQEILEAALLISVLLVITNLYHTIWGRSFVLRQTWIFYALVLGCAGAWLYAIVTPTVSEWFDYVGQEIMNSLIHLISLIFLIILSCVLPSNHFVDQPSARARLMIVSMVVIVLLAIIREGSEIILYLTGVTSESENVVPVLSGSVIGAGIGLSCGVILYYTLSNLRQAWAFRMCLILLAFICGNMASQIVMLLSQADLLPYTPIAWDTASLLPENSIPGRLLYAFIGYEATPSILQAVCYGLVMLVVMVGPLVRMAWPRILEKTKEL